MAGNCQKLKWNRRRLGLSQKEFAEKAGLCAATIVKLENDESAWATIKADTVDKIYSMFDSMASYQPSDFKVVMEDTKTEELVDPKALVMLSGSASVNYEETNTAKPNKKESSVIHSEGLSVDDKALLKLINVTHFGLNAAKSHEEFMVHVRLLKKLLKKR